MTQDYKEKYPIGSQWLTRGGDRAVVVDHEDDIDFPIIIWFKGSHSSITYRANPYGLQKQGLGRYDLIEPWTEPKKYVRWVNFYEDDESRSYKSKDMAESCADLDGRIACIRVPFTHGEGLEND